MVRISREKALLTLIEAKELLPLIEVKALLRLIDWSSGPRGQQFQ
jgi:hypothetical protein